MCLNIFLRPLIFFFNFPAKWEIILKYFKEGIVKLMTEMLVCIDIILFWVLCV